jgi:hypothetical protein
MTHAGVDVGMRAVETVEQPVQQPQAKGGSQMAIHDRAGTREPSRQREPRDRIGRKARAESSRHGPQQTILKRAEEVVEQA